MPGQFVHLIKQAGLIFAHAIPMDEEQQVEVVLMVLMPLGVMFMMIMIRMTMTR